MRSLAPLGPNHCQGGISTLAPSRPQPQLLRLPPILRKQCPSPMPNCSKAPRGLFVLLRVGRVFTAISISPGPSSRQSSSCYAVRAGRNLPDKEFRYLRTVIVTAAVHRGFSSKLRPKTNPSPRPISTGQLNALLRLHFRPINVVICHGPYQVDPVGELILEEASRLDAFSGYPVRRSPTSRALGRTTGTRELRPSRSSRTRDSFPQFTSGCRG